MSLAHSEMSSSGCSAMSSLGCSTMSSLGCNAMSMVNNATSLVKNNVISSERQTRTERMKRLENIALSAMCAMFRQAKRVDDWFL